MLASSVRQWPDLEHLVILDSLTYAGSRANLTEPDQDPRLTFTEGDIADDTLVSELLEKFNCDGIMHWAAELHVDQSIKNPAKFITAKINDTFSLLDLARRHDVALLQCSIGGSLGRLRPQQRRMNHFH